MSVNLFSMETLAGLIIGLLLGFFIKNFFKKKDNLDDYSTNLETLTNKIQEIHTQNTEDRGATKERLKEVKDGQAEVVKAAEAIRRTLVSGGGQQQGAWGQLVLNHILTKNLQFREGEEFETQKSFSTEEGDKIPDVIVHYPDGRDILVDSKVSLTAWDEYVNATDDHIKKDALKRHKTSIKKHIDNLADKNYQSIKEINTLDTIMMFCPNEDAIHKLPEESSSKLVEYALSKKITLTGPSSIFFNLKSVEHSWKTDKQSKNIKDIIDIANKVSSQAVEIYESAIEAKKSIEKTSQGIEKVTNKIKDGKGSFLSRIKKMNTLGGLFPKKLIPADIMDDEDPDDDPPAGEVSKKIPVSKNEDEKANADLIAKKKIK